jgi:hypothetical protein
MRIIRFLDKNGHICFGHDHLNGEATLLAGNIFESLQDTGQRRLFSVSA